MNVSLVASQHFEDTIFQKNIQESRKTAKFHCGTKAEADAENDWFVTILNSLGDDELTTGDEVGKMVNQQEETLLILEMQDFKLEDFTMIFQLLHNGIIYLTEVTL